MFFPYRENIYIYLYIDLQKRFTDDVMEYAKQVAPSFKSQSAKRGLANGEFKAAEGCITGEIRLARSWHSLATKVVVFLCLIINTRTDFDLIYRLKTKTLNIFAYL